MSVNRFCDTNVLIYAFDTSDPAKRATALAIVADAGRLGTGVISVQVLGEFFHATVRKKLLTATEAERAVVAFANTLRVEPIDAGLVSAAMAIHRQHGLRYWDALIVATANRAGCAEILSEDLNSGQIYNGSTIINPFVRP